MCYICNQSPCHPRCPNAEQAKAVHECITCNDGIFEGDHYFDSPAGPVCEWCISRMTAMEMMELTGETMSEAHAC